MSEPSQWRIARGKEAHRAGLKAEFWASVFLMLKGYRILARRHKTHVGEIDLIARRGNALVFVEVKSRLASASAAEALLSRQQARLARAAELYVANHPKLALLDIRFDVVLLSSGRFPRHLRDAWRPD
jgi:putative endonuclease